MPEFADILREVEQLAVDDLAMRLLVVRTAAARLEAEGDLIAAALARRTREEPATAALDVHEAAALLGVSVSWLRRASRRGLPFCRRVGRRIVFDRAGLVRWLDRRRR